MAEQFDVELSAAIRAVRLACRVCRNVQLQISPETLKKKDRSPVTIADFASQAIICRELALGPTRTDPIVAEEDSKDLRKPEQALFLQRICQELGRIGLSDVSPEDVCNWIDRGGASGAQERFWTLDPIDGTKGFLRGEQYAVSLALIVNGRIELAVLGCPNLPATPGQRDPVGLLLTAVRGGGARAVPLEGGSGGLAVRVSNVDDPAAARLCESVESSHSSHGWSASVAELLGITKRSLRIDSQAKYAAVARGQADFYLRLPTRPGYVEKIWDHAGGVLVVQEAGGSVTDVDGKPLEFHHGTGLSANRGVVVTNGRLHQAVLQAVAKSEQGNE